VTERERRYRRPLVRFSIDAAGPDNANGTVSDDVVDENGNAATNKQKNQYVARDKIDPSSEGGGKRRRTAGARIYL